RRRTRAARRLQLPPSRHGGALGCRTGRDSELGRLVRDGRRREHAAFRDPAPRPTACRDERGDHRALHLDDRRGAVRVLGSTHRPRLTTTPTNKGLTMEIHDALASALSAVTGAAGTDLVLSTGHAPLIRVDGAIRPVDGARAIDEATMAEYL